MMNIAPPQKATSTSRPLSAKAIKRWGCILAIAQASVSMDVESAYAANVDLELEGFKINNDSAEHQIHTFWQWVTKAGLSGDEALPSSSPGASTVTNLERYGFGLLPDASGESVRFARMNSENVGELCYLERRDAQDLEYEIQVSEDLVTWHTASEYVTEESREAFDSDFDRVRVRIRVNESADRLFIRVNLKLLPPNVLFISIDDLRNDLGSLGVAHAKTPHLDAFAAKSRLFSRHYVQVPTCGASRAALLSGMRPISSRDVDNDAIRNGQSDWGDRSLPTWFRLYGYRTLALGKVTHYPGGLTGSGWAQGAEELPGAWDRSWVPDSPWETPQDMMHGYANGIPRDRGVSPPWEAHDGPDSAYPDAWIADEAIEVLEDFVDEDDPWFFAVGFFKPHLPFAAPQRWFDIHDGDQIRVPESTQRHPNPSGWHSSNEMMGNYGHQGKDPRIDAEYAKKLRHAYAASTSYVDEQVGRFLQSFEELGLGENTIVVIWSDHGFHLGEHGIWGKHALYEESLLSPLMIWYPGISHPGATSDAIVETVDLFPTLMELARIDPPRVRGGFNGRSLVPYLSDPATPTAKPAFGYYDNDRTVRTDDWRLIELTDGVELFDFRENPDGQRVDPHDYPAVVDDLLAKLDEVPSF